MSEQNFKVYVLSGRSERDYSDCIAELAKATVPVDVLPVIEEEGIEPSCPSQPSLPVAGNELPQVGLEVCLRTPETSGRAL